MAVKGYFGPGTQNYDPTDTNQSDRPMSGSGGTMSIQDILSRYESSTAEARAANEKRYAEGIALADQAIARYKPGGDFGKGAEATYERGKKQFMGTGIQSLINSGLGGTSTVSALPLSYEQNVGNEFRLNLEDMRMGNLTEAEKTKMGFIEARSDPYPDYAMFAGLLGEVGQGGDGGYTGGGSKLSEGRAGPDHFWDDTGGGGGGGYTSGGYSENRNSTPIPYGSANAPKQTAPTWSLGDYTRSYLSGQSMPAANITPQTFDFSAYTAQQNADQYPSVFNQDIRSGTSTKNNTGSYNTPPRMVKL